MWELSASWAMKEQHISNNIFWVHPYRVLIQKWTSIWQEQDLWEWCSKDPLNLFYHWLHTTLKEFCKSLWGYRFKMIFSKYKVDQTISGLVDKKKKKKKKKFSQRMVRSLDHITYLKQLVVVYWCSCMVSQLG